MSDPDRRLDDRWSTTEGKVGKTAGLDHDRMARVFVVDIEASPWWKGFEPLVKNPRTVEARQPIIMVVFSSW